MDGPIAQAALILACGGSVQEIRPVLDDLSTAIVPGDPTDAAAQVLAAISRVRSAGRKNDAKAYRDQPMF